MAQTSEAEPKSQKAHQMLVEFWYFDYSCFSCFSRHNRAVPSSWSQPSPIACVNWATDQMLLKDTAALKSRMVRAVVTTYLWPRASSQQRCLSAWNLAARFQAMWFCLAGVFVIKTVEKTALCHSTLNYCCSWCLQAISHRSLELLSFCWGNRWAYLLLKGTVNRPYLSNHCFGPLH